MPAWKGKTMKHVGTFILAAVALLIAGCGTLDPNISQADGTIIGIGGKANPDGTAQAAIGYFNFGGSLVPSVGPDGKAITITGHCGEQREISTIIVTNSGANGNVSAPNGVSNAFSAKAVLATGQ